MKCPICNKKLDIVQNNEKSKSYKCENKHTFDISKYGYVNLIPFNSFSGDNKEMVDSRVEIMKEGYFEPLALKLKDIIEKLEVKSILDLGCGEGYYDRFISENKDYNIWALDISKNAILKASKLSNANINYIIANIYDLPFFDNEFDLLLNCFAPLEEKEFHRVCNKYFIKVIPNTNHLIELKEQLYENIKETNVDDSKLELFDLVEEINLNYVKRVEKMKSLFMMTPYFYTTHNNFDLELKECDVTFDFLIRVYRKK